MKNNFNLGNFTISYNNFIKYQNMVRSILRSLYKDNIMTEGGLTFISSLPFESGNRIKSIINYANSNIYLASSLVKDFDIKDDKDLVRFIYENKEDLFLERGKYFKYVITKLKKTEAAGEKNEEVAAEKLTQYIRNRTGKEIKVSRTDTDCRDDLLHGIDLFFYINERKYTCQVKPLKSSDLNGDEYIIRSSGKLKKLNVDYLAFINTSTNNFLLFQNRKVKVIGYSFKISKDSLVKLS